MTSRPRGGGQKTTKKPVAKPASAPPMDPMIALMAEYGLPRGHPMLPLLAMLHAMDERADRRDAALWQEVRRDRAEEARAEEAQRGVST